jgi:hypothetical protein
MGDVVTRYLDELASRLRTALGDALSAVYLSGSTAVGAQRPGSDIDVIVAVDGAGREALEAVVATCSHDALPCPARKLELVAYDLAVLADPGARPRWSLNFDTGAGEHHLGWDPGAEPAHWFVLDLAFAHRHAVALWGPPPSELIADPGPEAVRQAFAEQVAWYEGNEPGEPAATAARRARHWEQTGEFAPKNPAG